MSALFNGLRSQAGAFSATCHYTVRSSISARSGMASHFYSTSSLAQEQSQPPRQTYTSTQHLIRSQKPARWSRHSSPAPLSPDMVREASDPVATRSTSELASSPEHLDQKWNRLAKKELDEQNPHRSLTPYCSRTVRVAGQDVARITKAWKDLNRTLAESGIRKELKMTERYEKPTLKRQRLNSQRHRRRFKHQVAQDIASIMRLKKKGL